MLAFYVQLLDDPELRSQLEKAYYEYRGLMFALAKSILKEDNLAEDAVHETFARVAGQFSKISNFSQKQMEHYFLIATRNVSLNMIRDRKREITVAYPEPEDSGAYSEDVLEEIVANASFEEIVEALNQLPEKQKDVLYLYAVNEMSQKDIAELLQISEDAVSKRVQRGRKQLRSLLRKPLPETDDKDR